jgi:outer membrane receptor protein involved in Fe transport
MASYGDWKWINDLEDVKLFDDSQVEIGSYDLFLAGVHVGDAAQLTFALGLDYELLKGFKIGADYNYYGRHFADFDPLARTSAPADGEDNPDTWELPTYGLFDLNLRYNFRIAGVNATFLGKMNNLFDTEYISDAYDGSSHDWDTAKVYYGWGRSWSFSLMLNF